MSFQPIVSSTQSPSLAGHSIMRVIFPVAAAAAVAMGYGDVAKIAAMITGATGLIFFAVGAGASLFGRRELSVSMMDSAKNFCLLAVLGYAGYFVADHFIGAPVNSIGPPISRSLDGYV